MHTFITRLTRRIRDGWHWICRRGKPRPYQDRDELAWAEMPQYSFAVDWYVNQGNDKPCLRCGKLIPFCLTDNSSNPSEPLEKAFCAGGHAVRVYTPVGLRRLPTS